MGDEKLTAALREEVRVLELVATGERFEGVADAIASFVERAIPGGVAVVQRFDEERHRLDIVAAPSLSADLREALEAVRADSTGLTAGAALHQRRPVYTSDVTADPLWVGMWSRWVREGLRAAWSVPVVSGSDSLHGRLGVVTLFAREPGAPNGGQRATLERAAALARIAFDSAHASRAQRTNEAWGRSLFDHAADSIFIHDATATVVDVNASACESLGYERHELIGKKPSFFDPDVTDSALNAIDDMLERGTSVTFEARHRRKNGELFPVEVRIAAVRGGANVNRLAIVRDISARREAERALSESAAHFQAVLEASLDAIVTMDANGNIVQFNHAAERTFRVAASEVLGRPLAEVLMSAPAAELHRSGIKRYLSTGVARVLDRRIEVTAMRAGEEFPVEMSVVRLGIEGPAVFAGFIRDISDRKEAELALVRSEQALRHAQELAEVGSFTVDAARRGVTASDEVKRILGFGEGAYSLDDLVAVAHPEERRQLVAALAGAFAGTPLALEQRFVADGHTRVVDLRAEGVCDAAGRVVELLGVMKDLTARRSLEERLRQTQKMDAIGRLAGGIAHDFNNLLTVINGTGEMLLADSSMTPSLRDDLTTILDAGRRAAALTAQLLAFGRQAIVDPRVIDLNETVGSLARMLGRVIGEDIDVDVQLASEPVYVECDPGQMDQVIMNLVLNARDAMRAGGTLTLATGSRRPPQAERASLGLVDGQYVTLTVTDTGEGMTDSVRGKIFEPFFTTKAKGEGTGLGLATVYSIVEQSHGAISVESERGRGTMFVVWLPLAPADPAVERRPVAGVRGTETILVVEDEGALRRLVDRMLSSYGYRVLVAVDGVDALRVFEEHAERIDLLLTDVVMPNMGGRELSERLAKRSPGLPTLYMSGYTDDEVIRRGVSGSVGSFLAKPFTAAALAREVRRALVRSGAP